MPDSNRSGTSTTATRGRSPRPPPAATRSPTRGQSWPRARRAPRRRRTPARPPRRGRARRPPRPRPEPLTRRSRSSSLGEQLVDHGVGRERRGAQLAERAQRLRLARAEAAGQPHERGPAYSSGGGWRPAGASGRPALVAAASRSPAPPGRPGRRPASAASAAGGPPRRAPAGHLAAGALVGRRPRLRAPPRPRGPSPRKRGGQGVRPAHLRPGEDVLGGPRSGTSPISSLTPAVRAGGAAPT